MLDERDIALVTKLVEEGDDSELIECVRELERLVALRRRRQAAAACAPCCSPPNPVLPAAEADAKAAPSPPSFSTYARSYGAEASFSMEEEDEDRETSFVSLASTTASTSWSLYGETEGYRDSLNFSNLSSKSSSNSSSTNGKRKNQRQRRIRNIVAGHKNAYEEEGRGAAASSIALEAQTEVGMDKECDHHLSEMKSFFDNIGAQELVFDHVGEQQQQHEEARPSKRADSKKHGRSKKPAEAPAAVVSAWPSRRKSAAPVVDAA